MYLEKVEYVQTDNQKDYLKEIKQITDSLCNYGIDYNIYESRHNSNNNGYIAEITYGYWV